MAKVKASDPWKASVAPVAAAPAVDDDGGDGEAVKVRVEFTGPDAARVRAAAAAEGLALRAYVRRLVLLDLAARDR